MMKLSPQGMMGLVWSPKHICSGTLCPSAPPPGHLCQFILQDLFRPHLFQDPIPTTSGCKSVRGLAQYVAYKKCSINASIMEQSSVRNLRVPTLGPESNAASVNSGSPQLVSGSTIHIPQASASLAVNRK